MSFNLLTATKEATPERMTELLYEGGSLISGQVTQVGMTTSDSVHANTARLGIAYSEGAKGSLPTKLFLKICKPGSALFGDNEILYYARMTPPISPSPAPTCYHHAYSSETGRYHLLLEDMSDTHQVSWNGEPTLAKCLPTVETLARMHSYWLDHPSLAEATGRYPDKAVIERYVSHAEPGLQPLLEDDSLDLSAYEREILLEAFSKQPKRMIERANRGNGITFIHGDLNPGNILTPLNPLDRAFLIDHQPFKWSLTAWLGVSDLAYMMVHWWEPEIRRALEKPLLKAYHERLTELGAVGYSWENLWEDYLLSAVQSVYVVTDWCIDPKEKGEMRWVWELQLRKTLVALKDLTE